MSGNSATIVNPQAMVALYGRAKIYSRTVESAGKTIKAKLAILNDPSLRDGLNGGQGEAMKEAIDELALALENVSRVSTSVATLMNNKLAAKETLDKDKHGFGNKAQDTKGRQGNVTLKR